VETLGVVSGDVGAVDVWRVEGPVIEHKIG